MCTAVTHVLTWPETAATMISVSLLATTACPAEVCVSQGVLYVSKAIIVIIAVANQIMLLAN
jgi:hypothetical protein